MSTLDATVAHLRALVACDTRNPPRAIAADGALVRHVLSSLPGFAVTTRDLGDGCISLLCERGQPRVLINVHLDTVPAVDSWSADAHVLRSTGDRLVGLGAADTKGAAACLLALAAETSGDAAFLFTTDEEAGPSRCVEAFVAEPRRYDLVIVSEPTCLRAVVAHRGIGSALGVFSGRAGHGSHPRALADSAVHGAVRWASRALAFAEAEEQVVVGGLTGIRFNLGVLSGGHKSNVIADRAEVRFGVRARPGEQPDALVGRITALAEREVTWTTTFMGPSLASSEIAIARARERGLEVSAPVDYWTEAALFARAGLPVFVYGPGDIAQAHAADEWVSLGDLEGALAFYRRVLA